MLPLSFGKDRFVDFSRLRCAGGTGGKGSLSHQTLRRKYNLRPDGGHGGNGGSIIIVADPHEQSLRRSQPHVQAEKGGNGSSQERLGRNGKNLIIRVPCGVIVRRIVTPEEEDLYGEVGELDEINDDDDDDEQEENDEEENGDEADTTFANWNVDRDSTNNQGVEFFALDDDDSFGDDDFTNGIAEDTQEEEDDNIVPYAERKRVYLADLDKPGAHVMVARGGRGGQGTMFYSSVHGPLPEPKVLIQKAKPEPGEVAYLELELKLIADVGLVGFPNAVEISPHVTYLQGKSSLLRAMSRAAPEVAPYPFTTLHPLMGVIEYADGMHIKVADIPGLIAGASQGRGKGIDFLRHIERTKALCYMLDVAGTEGRDPHEDLRVLVEELAAYGDGTLLERDALVVANKVDLIEPERLPDLLASIQETADSLGIERWSPVAGVSAGVSGEGLAGFSKDIRSIIEQLEEVEEKA
eukprot:scaffold1000_cov166-Amphora_coffeaeformis.AAC.21